MGNAYHARLSAATMTDPDRQDLGIELEVGYSFGGQKPPGLSVGVSVPPEPVTLAEAATFTVTLPQLADALHGRDEPPILGEIVTQHVLPAATEPQPDFDAMQDAIAQESSDESKNPDLVR